MDRRTFLGSSVAAAGLLTTGCAVRSTGSSLAVEPGLVEGPIKLCYNENPLGLCAAARQAVIDGIPEANRYPDDWHAKLKDALAIKHNVPASNIVLGNGSTEALQMAVQVFGQRGARFIQADPTYEDVTRYAAPYDLEVTKVPLRPDYSHDLERMRQIANQTNGDVVVYICSPNNPTATITASDELDEWIRTASDNVSFLVDEAYYEYAEGAEGYHSALPFIDTHPNVVIFRTFSKVYGMAGIRLGYALAHETTAAQLRELQSVSNANHLALAAGLASLADPDFLGYSVNTNATAKQILYNVLGDLDLSHLPSHTNFVMHRINADLGEYTARMLDAGFIIGRRFPPMLDYNRISIGTPEQMERFAETLRDFRSKGWV